MSSTNNSYSFVMDKHCAMVEECFQGLEADAFEQYESRSVQDDFAQAVEMEWVKTNSPHNEVQQILTLSNFMPVAVNSNTAGSKAKKVSQSSVDVDAVPKAHQIVKTQYRKYTETQVKH